MAAGGSVDRDNTYVFGVSTHSVLESMAKSLSYWSTGNGDTMVTIWNPADEEQDFAFTLYFAGGHYILPVQLGPRASEMLNISELIKNQIPDSEGNTIPVGVHDGSAEIAGSLGENQHILVGIDAGIYNAQKATCYNGCITCQGVASEFISPNESDVDLNNFPIGSSVQLSFLERLGSGLLYDATGQSQWLNVNTNSPVTVSDGLVQAVNPGSATLTALDNVLEPVYAYICSQNPPMCPVAVTYPNASQAVAVIYPNGIRVEQDSTTTYSCPGGGIYLNQFASYRIITYSIRSGNGTINQPIQIYENVPPTNNSCYSNPRLRQATRAPITTL